jgi:transposase
MYMRGVDESQDSLFSYGCLDERVPAGHPLRPIRRMADEALQAMDPDFAALYSPIGRPSIPPEQQLRALLVMVLYSIRSERQLMEELSYNLLYRWFVGLGVDEAVWDATVFTKNRERFIDGEIARKFFYETVEQARAQDAISSEHFTVDGTLIEAWASQKSFRPKEEPKGQPGKDDPGNPTVSFRGEKRSNQTHQSTTDPDARLARKANGQEAKLAFCGNVMTENRNGLVVETELEIAGGTAERDAALEMTDRIQGQHRITVGADKAYDTKDFVRQTRDKGATPHVAQNTNRPGGSAIDARTTQHSGYEISQRKRKLVEEFFGWLKTVAGQRKTKYRGIWRVGWIFTFAAAAYNLVRMRTLQAAALRPANA